MHIYISTLFDGRPNEHFVRAMVSAAHSSVLLANNIFDKGTLQRQTINELNGLAAQCHRQTRMLRDHIMFVAKISMFRKTNMSEPLLAWEKQTFTWF